MQKIAQKVAIEITDEILDICEVHNLTPESFMHNAVDRYVSFLQSAEDSLEDPLDAGDLKEGVSYNEYVRMQKETFAKKYSGKTILGLRLRINETNGSYYLIAQKTKNKKSIQMKLSSFHSEKAIKENILEILDSDTGKMELYREIVGDKFLPSN